MKFPLEYHKKCESPGSTPDSGHAVSFRSSVVLGLQQFSAIQWQPLIPHLIPAA